MSSIISESENNDSKLKCPECDKVFTSTLSYSSKKLLHNHRRDMHQQEYKCNDCDEVFPTNGTRYSHFKMNHRQLIFDCSQCDSSFAVKKTLKKHVESAHIPSSCTICDAKLSKWDLKIHLESVHKQFKCQECEEVFLTNGKRTYHFDVVHKQLVFKCSQCEFSTNAKGNLKQHITSVHDQSHYVTCPICDVRITKRRLQKHQEAVHDNVKNFSCDHCEFKTYSKQSKVAHMRRKHDPVKLEKKFDKCTFCNEEFQNLHWHVTKVHSLVRLKCDQCVKQYLNQISYI